ncbi:MAG: glucoamylase family protein, partial [Mariniphaga sp.]
FIDEMKAFRAIDEIPVVDMLTAAGYDSHSELRWTYPLPGLSYRIYASYDGGQSFNAVGETNNDYYLDFVPDSAKNSMVSYRVVTLFQQRESSYAEATAEIRDFSDEELLDMVQQYTFRYFWEGAHHPTGMILERSNGNENTVASGATGMGLMAMIVAHERGYEASENIKERILLILDFLENTERYHGAWSHWYNAETWNTQPFTPDDDGGDIVETSFVAAALIALRNYFTGPDAESLLIRQTVHRLWEEIDWNWYRNEQNVLIWHWSPNIGFQKNMQVRGWMETLITYIMAASSPTHPIPVEAYHQGWARNGAIVNPRTFYDYEIQLAPDWGGPLFWIHYSHLGIDPRGLQDEYADYWQEYVNTALIHHAYAIDNPSDHENYSANNWGLTASDDPFGYTAHQPVSNDNGTISPTAALASMPYTPEESMNALKYFYRQRGQELFGQYGFYDAFNDNLEWVAENYIGIDQGPIVVMIENHRTGLLWELVMQDPDVQAGLDTLGFQYQVVSNAPVKKEAAVITVYPNPANGHVNVILPGSIGARPLQLKLHTMDGRLVMSKEIAGGSSVLSIDCSELSDGFYVINIANGEVTCKARLIVQQ